MPASARSIAWRQLVPGAVGILAVLAAMTAIVVFGRVGARRGETVRLYATTSGVRGVLTGTEVWLAGQRVGRITEVAFAAPSHDTTKRVVLALVLRREAFAALRRDSRARLKGGGGLVGAPVLFIEPGTDATPALEPGDTVTASAQPDPETIAASLTGGARDLPAIARDLRELGDRLRGARSTLGALLSDSGRTPIAGTGAAMGGVLDRSRADSGSLRAFLREGGPASHARTLVARADTIRSLLLSDKTSLGRFRRDSSLARELDRLRTDLGAAQARLAGASEALGGAGRDMTLVRDVSRVRAQVASLIEDIKRHPFRYLVF